MTHRLEDHIDVARTDPTSGQVPVYNSTTTKYTPGKAGTGGVKVTLEDVTVTAGASSGTATVVASSTILGYYPVSNQDQHVDSIVISGTTLTVTLAANATANNVFKVAVLEP